MQISVHRTIKVSPTKEEQPARYIAIDCELHGHTMETDHVAFGVGDDRDETMFADRKLRTHDRAAGCGHPTLLNCAILTGENRPSSHPAQVGRRRA